MDISKHSFVTPNEILSDVLKLVDDERYELNSRGYYSSLIQQALEGLAFDTFFDKKSSDFLFPKEDLRLELPIGAFNPKHIYIYNGSECNIATAQKVWWKRNYTPAKNGGKGYFADNRGNNFGDPFYPSNVFDQNRTPNGEILSPNPAFGLSGSYFYDIQEGIVVFSSACRSFTKVHMKYYGTGCEIGEAPIVPLFLREAVSDFVTEFALRIKIAKPDGRAFMQLWQIYDRRLNRDEQFGIATGSWPRASKRVKTMSASKRADFGEYYGRSQYEAGL